MAGPSCETIPHWEQIKHMLFPERFVARIWLCAVGAALFDTAGKTVTKTVFYNLKKKIK